MKLVNRVIEFDGGSDNPKRGKYFPTLYDWRFLSEELGRLDVWNWPTRCERKPASESGIEWECTINWGERSWSGSGVNACPPDCSTEVNGDFRRFLQAIDSVTGATFFTTTYYDPKIHG